VIGALLGRAPINLDNKKTWILVLEF